MGDTWRTIPPLLRPGRTRNFVVSFVASFVAFEAGKHPRNSPLPYGRVAEGRFGLIPPDLRLSLRGRMTKQSRHLARIRRTKGGLAQGTTGQPMTRFSRIPLRGKARYHGLAYLKEPFAISSDSPHCGLRPIPLRLPVSTSPEVE